MRSTALLSLSLDRYLSTLGSSSSISSLTQQTPLVVVETGKQRRKSFDTTSPRLTCQIELGTPSRDIQLQN